VIIFNVRLLNQSRRTSLQIGKELHLLCERQKQRSCGAFKLGRFKEVHKHLDQARLITVRLKDRTRTAQIDSTRAELLIAEVKFHAAEAAARRAATALEKVGHGCWLADVLILKAIAQARLGKPARAQITLQRAIEVAHEADALNKAGLAALAMIEEINGLSPDTLQAAAYQQAREWLVDSQSREVLSRLSAAGGRLADVFDASGWIVYRPYTAVGGRKQSHALQIKFYLHKSRQSAQVFPFPNVRYHTDGLVCEGYSQHLLQVLMRAFTLTGLANDPLPRRIRCSILL